MTKRSIEHKDSMTASYTCMSRALAARHPDERLRGPDYLAEKIFVPARIKPFLIVPILRKVIVGKTAPGMNEYVLARTKLLDSVFKDALANCFDQIVILGAGFDTRALRFARLNRSTQIIELDDPATQQPKLDILKRKKIDLPRALTFAAIDFTTQNLGDVLSAAGYVENRRTLFLWEGVTMYLDQTAVDSTLAFIRRSAASGSIVAFDYVYASVVRHEHRYDGEREVAESVAKVGEPWTFGIEEGAIDGFMAERGFEIVSHYASRELEKAYFTAEDGTLFGHVNGTHCLIVAKTR